MVDMSKCPYCGRDIMVGEVELSEVTFGISNGLRFISKRWFKWISYDKVEHSKRRMSGLGEKKLTGRVSHVLMRSSGEAVSCIATYCPTCRKVFAEFKVEDDGVVP